MSANPRNWATAANIHRIGDTYLNTQAAIDRFGALTREIGAHVKVLPYGHQPGETDDCPHLDLG